MANKSITFREGEFTPQLDARADVEKYGYGCRHLNNMLPRIYSDATRRPGTSFIASTVDWLSSFFGIIAYENTEACYENLVVSTLEQDDTMPNLLCYENKIVCYENVATIISGITAFADNIVCYENNVVFYENKLVVY